MNASQPCNTILLTGISLLFPNNNTFQEKYSSTSRYLTHNTMAFYHLKRLHVSFIHCVKFFSNKDLFKKYKNIFPTPT